MQSCIKYTCSFHHCPGRSTKNIKEKKENRETKELGETKNLAVEVWLHKLSYLHKYISFHHWKIKSKCVCWNGQITKMHHVSSILRCIFAHINISEIQTVSKSYFSGVSFMPGQQNFRLSAVEWYSPSGGKFPETTILFPGIKRILPSSVRLDCWFDMFWNIQEGYLF